MDMSTSLNKFYWKRWGFYAIVIFLLRTSLFGVNSTIISRDGLGLYIILVNNIAYAVFAMAGTLIYHIMGVNRSLIMASVGYLFYAWALMDQNTVLMFVATVALAFYSAVLQNTISNLSLFVAPVSTTYISFTLNLFSLFFAIAVGGALTGVFYLYQVDRYMVYLFFLSLPYFTLLLQLFSPPVQYVNDNEELNVDENPWLYHNPSLTRQQWLDGIKQQLTDTVQIFITPRVYLILFYPIVGGFTLTFCQINLAVTINDISSSNIVPWIMMISGLGNSSVVFLIPGINRIKQLYVYILAYLLVILSAPTVLMINSDNLYMGFILCYFFSLGAGIMTVYSRVVTRSYYGENIFVADSLSNALYGLGSTLCMCTVTFFPGYIMGLTVMLILVTLTLLTLIIGDWWVRPLDLAQVIALPSDQVESSDDTEAKPDQQQPSDGSSDHSVTSH